MIISAWFSFLVLMTEKLCLSNCKKRTLANGEKCSGATKECTAMSSENNRQRHCRPAADKMINLLTVKKLKIENCLPARGYGREFFKMINRKKVIMLF